MLSEPLAKPSKPSTAARIKKLQDRLDSPVEFWKRIAVISINRHPEWGLEIKNGRVQMREIPF